jgi:hypothetical protein
MAERLVTLPAKQVAWVRFPVPARPRFSAEKWLFSVTLRHAGGTFSSTAIEIIKWVKKIDVVQAKVSHILRPGKASEKTPKGINPPSLCEILQNASRKEKHNLISCRVAELHHLYELTGHTWISWAVA